MLQQGGGGGHGRWYFCLRGFNGDKTRIGCLTPAFSGAHKWAGMLRNPCVLGTPTKGTKSELAACHLPLHSRLLVSYGGKNRWPSASKRLSQTGSEGPLPNGNFWALGCPLVGSFPQQGHIITFCLSNPMLSPPFGASASCSPYPPPPFMS